MVFADDIVHLQSAGVLRVLTLEILNAPQSAAFLYIYKSRWLAHEIAGERNF